MLSLLSDTIFFAVLGIVFTILVVIGWYLLTKTGWVIEDEHHGKP